MSLKSFAACNTYNDELTQTLSLVLVSQDSHKRETLKPGSSEAKEASTHTAQWRRLSAGAEWGKSSSCESHLHHFPAVSSLPQASGDNLLIITPTLSPPIKLYLVYLL